MRRIYCNKRQIEIDKFFIDCDQCFKNKQAGFTEHQMCKDFNITFVEEEDPK
jgi:hypothetical protein